ncbi:MAG: helix-hairpin-helix domain-containing protein [Bacteroidales bacterium]|nr:helix-hairpin-helix domain-containing protein [Bacteroidales bacterium]
MNSRLIFTMVYCLLFGTAISQETEMLNSNIEDLIESVIVDNEVEQDISVIAEDLNYYLTHPLNLNAASSEDLSRLHMLNPFQIKSLQDYIRKNGSLLSIYELPLVFGFSTELAGKLQPFVTVDEVSGENNMQDVSAKEMLDWGKHQLLLRSGKVLERQEGYVSLPDSLLELNPNKQYLGSPYTFYSRYRFRYRNQLSLGVTMEKDAGEQFFSGSNPYGFDFNSGHFFLSNTKWIDRLVIGDYKVRYGQGLVAWTGFTINKSPMVMNMMKNIHRIDPYTSKNENLYFRGVALEKKFGDFRGSFFYSNRNLDANVLHRSDTGGLVVSSLLNTGYHRLPRELEDENVLNEQITGGSFSLNQPTFRVSINFMDWVLDGELQKTDRPYKMFDFSGSHNSNLSVDYRLSLGRFYFFGEEALSNGGGLAFLNGCYGQLSSAMGVVLLHRSYDRDYQAFYSGAFGEKTGNRNESGLYMGANAGILPNLTLKGYMDVYRFPWLSYLTDGPSEGWDCMVDMEYEFGDRSSVNFRFRRSEDMENYLGPNSKIVRLMDYKKTNIRGHLRYRITDKLVLQNRIEKVFVRSSEFSSGLMFYQDISFKPENAPLGFDIRYAVFDTDSYKDRIYAYENDVLYAFSVPAYYGKGYRAYINLKYVYKNSDWWLKLARTGYTDRETIGTGLNQIDGNSKTTVTFQVGLKF